MKVIFLDFDGVLNGQKDVAPFVADQGVRLLPEKLLLIKQMTAATDAKIILSTSWREHWSADAAQCDTTGLRINSIFSQYGLQIQDKTPSLRTGRETEIKSWLDTHPETTHFVVLDDGLLSADFLDGHFVKTSAYFGGLDETDVKKAIEILGVRA